MFDVVVVVPVAVVVVLSLAAGKLRISSRRVSSNC